MMMTMIMMIMMMMMMMMMVMIDHCVMSGTSLCTQAVFDTLGEEDKKGATLVVSGDGRYYNKEAIQVRADHAKSRARPLNHIPFCTSSGVILDPSNRIPFFIPSTGSLFSSLPSHSLLHLLHRESWLDFSVAPKGVCTEVDGMIFSTHARSSSRWLIRVIFSPTTGHHQDGGGGWGGADLGGQGRAALHARGLGSHPVSFLITSRVFIPPAVVS
jgi:hypothetical protein